VWPYSQALPFPWQVKIQLYFLYIAIAATLVKRRFSGIEEINLKLITSLVLVLSLLMSQHIKHKLTETGFSCEKKSYTFLS